ncbi:hypothetical protein [Pseudomonas lutea]|uniref:Uncharacterized protein n=1 Tax=Pseudomonas lutea TaxID=243924 RepID=A0A9X0JGV2_9PSED|nr:hypothetical protein [Pseudomonas lutea]KGF62100.1 hypothetical protein LT42_25425 [Pseudomonas lutea]
MSYLSLTPAQDWFFRHAAPNPGQPPIVYQVAVWALKPPKEEGGRSEIIGLIAPNFGGMESRMLHEPPPVPGCYLHRDQLNEEELKALAKR